MSVLSSRSRYACNPIDEDDVIAEAIEKRGEKVIKVNRGDPAVYFPTPEYIKEAYINAIRENKTHYTSARGVNELVEAIILRYKRMY
ncbi:MAG: hypothetical protein ABSD68_03600, partial [Candidatus Micrarchaeales archaeon]